MRGEGRGALALNNSHRSGTWKTQETNSSLPDRQKAAIWVKKKRGWGVAGTGENTPPPPSHAVCYGRTTRCSIPPPLRSSSVCAQRRRRCCPRTAAAFGTGVPLLAPPSGTELARRAHGTARSRCKSRSSGEKVPAPPARRCPGPRPRLARGGSGGGCAASPCAAPRRCASCRTGELPLGRVAAAGRASRPSGCRVPGREGAALPSRFVRGQNQLWPPKPLLLQPRWWPRIIRSTCLSRGRTVPWKCRQWPAQLKRRRYLIYRWYSRSFIFPYSVICIALRKSPGLWK